MQALLMLAVLAAADTDHDPGPRSAACLIYDEHKRQVLLVGGDRWSSPRDQLERTEIWTWNGQQWGRLPRSELMARTLNAAAYDRRRHRLVSFWGMGREPEQRWEWDGKAWRTAPDPRATARLHPALGYDAIRRRLILFGGTAPRQAPATGWEFPRDTWENSKRGQWAIRASEGPRGRTITCGSIVADLHRKQLLLFGGLGESPDPGQPQTVFNDTWIWDGKAWKQASGGPAPRPRFGHALAFDRRSGVVLLYGGRDITGPIGDMWEWDGQRWTEIALRGATPGLRSNHAMTYDPARHRTILYGGDNEQPRTLNDTWEWDGASWRRVH